jgi:hypothetical protein
MIEACRARLQPMLAELATDAPADAVILTVVVAGLVIAAASAPWLLGAYGRAMSRYMGFRQVAAPSPAWWQQRARLLHRRTPEAEAPVAPEALSDAMRQRERNLLLATACAAGVFLAGGIAVLALFYEVGSWLTELNSVFLLAALITGPALVNVRPQVAVRPLIVGVALALAASAALETLEDSADWEYLLLGVPAVFAGLALCLHRRLRALFVPLSVLAATAATGVLAAALALLPLACASGAAEPDARDWLLAAASLGGVVLALGGCLWIGMQLLAGLARLYERGVVSDLSLVAASGAVIISALVAFGADAPGLSPATMAVAWLLWWAATVAVYAGARRLLVLRVFARDQRAERLLDAVQTRWRCAGPVMQIGGPDLARLNIDPYELVKFVSLRTHDLFLPGAPTREQLLDCLDLASDREGRFRINEVFCFDTAWRSTVEELMDLADAILLDLRGFRAERAGTAYEITRLAAGNRLGRVVAIGDAATDWPCVDRLFGEAPRGQERRLDARSPQAVEECVQALVEVATKDGAVSGVAAPINHLQTA